MLASLNRFITAIEIKASRSVASTQYIFLAMHYDILELMKLYVLLSPIYLLLARTNIEKCATLCLNCGYKREHWRKLSQSF
jgi:hypothetical protein